MCCDAEGSVDLHLFPFPEDLLCEGLVGGQASPGSVYMTLRTEGLWGLVQRSDIPGLLTGARIGR